MTLIEILVAMFVSTLICLIAFSFYRHFMGDLDRQKQVASLQDAERNAVDCINRYLIAGGVSGDSVFFDPHNKLSLPYVNGGHRVFDVASDSTSISVYGNYSGGAGSLTAPVVDKAQHGLQTDRPDLFRTGGYAYIYAGSAQEVARIMSVAGSTVTVENDLFAYYPKGTLIFPLERVRIYRGSNQTLQVDRESASGTSVFPRGFIPSSHPGDSLDFKIKSVDHQAGQVAYSLTFMARAHPSNVLLARRSDQTIFVRGF